MVILKLDFSLSVGDIFQFGLTEGYVGFILVRAV
jgi:hypothetical protein